MRTTLRLALVLAIVAASAPAHAQGNCTAVAGAFHFTRFEFTSATTAYAKGIVDGDLAGAFVANYFDISQSGEGVLQLNGSHTITTAGGTLRTLDRIHLQPDTETGWFRPNSQLRIVEGGAPYAEATTGLLHTHGRVNPGTLEGSIEWKGRICAPSQSSGRTRASRFPTRRKHHERLTHLNRPGATADDGRHARHGQASDGQRRDRLE